MPDVKDAFRAPQQVEPPTAVAYVPSAQAYNDALQALQAAVAKAAEPNADPSAVKATMDAADSARTATKKVSSGLPPDHEAQIDAVVGALMMEPITAAQNAFPKPGEELNRAGGAFCTSFAPITHKFPFSPAAKDEATLQELGEVFRPTGSKLAAFEDTLKKVIVCKSGKCGTIENATINVNPVFLNFLNQAAKLSFALYGDSGTDPNYHYTLTPLKSDQVDGYELAVNGDSSKLAGGAAKSYTWPGSGTPSFKLSLNLAGGTGLGVQSRDGLWSLFRFFADADRTTANGSSYNFLWKFRAGVGGSPPVIAGRPLEYEFTVDANIFSKEFLAGMRCVPTVAK
jgi:hypothetical protein